MPEYPQLKLPAPPLSRRQRTLVATACAGLMLASNPAAAGTSSGVMPVAATLLDTCLVAATPMLFGDISLAGGGAIDSSALITLTCTPLASYQVALNHGVNASGTQRRMKNVLTNDYVPYNIYSDSARTTAWGDQAGIDTVSGNAGLAGTVVLTAFGRIPANAPPAPAGAYADVVTVTVTF